MLAHRAIGQTMLYVDTAERSNRMNGGGQQDTRYVVKASASRGRNTVELGSFADLDVAVRYMVAYKMSFGLVTGG